MDTRMCSMWRARTAATLVLSLLVALLVTAPPAHAAAGSIVFIKDHNVWIMPGADAGAARKVTTDGTSTSYYSAAAQDDSGRIVAVLGGKGDFDRLVRMDQSGNRLGEPFRPHGALAWLPRVDVNPAGDVVTFTTQGGCGGGLVYDPWREGWCEGVDFAYADGRDSSAISRRLQGGKGASWYADDRIVLYYTNEEQTGYGPALSVYKLGKADADTWLDTCPGFYGPDDSEFMCDNAGYPQINRGMDRLVYAVPSEYDGTPTRMRVYSMPAAPPATPEYECWAEGPTGADFDAPSNGEFGNLTWSPDGDALAWELGAYDDTTPPGSGIYVATGFASACEGAFLSAQLIVPGGSHPDWGPAAVGPYAPGGGGGPNPPPSGDGGEVVRLAGANRFATGADAARRLWPDGAQTVVLATGFNYPDALAGGPVAARHDAPLLLATTHALPDEVRDVMIALAPSRVILLGGASALSAKLEAQVAALPSKPTISRIAGSQRFETAERAAAEAGRGSGGDVVIATGLDYPDALSAGSLMAGDAPVPVTLATRDRLMTPLAAGERGILIGGTSVLGAGVEEAARKQAGAADRLFGSQRFATSQAVADFALRHRITGSVPLVVATGQNYPDALSAGAVTARTGGPLLLIPTSGPTADQAAWITANRQRFSGAFVMGGAGAVSDQAVAQLRELLHPGG